MAIIVQCRNCGKVFSVFPCDIKRGRGRFCSTSCSITTRNINRQWETPIIRRFFKYVQLDIKNKCWLWLGSTHKVHGYGQFHDESRTPKNIHAFRWAYEYFKEPLPSGYEPDHLCRVRLCVNPDHLEGVTRRENILRSNCPPAINARKILCKWGHPLDGVAGRRGGRRCLTCHRQNESKRQLRRENQRVVTESE